MKAFAFGLALLQTSFAAVLPYPESNATLSRRGEVCAHAQFMPYDAVGGSSGGLFCDTRWPSSIVLRGMATYSKGADILGLELTWSDDTVTKWGSGFNTPKSGQITFGPGELVTNAWMAGNGKGTRLGKIHIKTSAQEVDLGLSTASDTYNVNVGSGLLVGVTGACGLDIDSLALVFVRPRVKNVSIYNTRITDDELNARRNAQPTGNASMVHYWNADPKNKARYAFAWETSYTQERTVSQSTATTFGASAGFEIKVGIPAIADVTVKSEVHWGIETVRSTLLTERETVAIRPSMIGVVPPKSGIDCSVIIWEGSGTFSYTSTVTLLFDDGSSITYDEPGTMSSKRYTSSNVYCRPAISEQPPANYAVGQVLPY